MFVSKATHSISQFSSVQFSHSVMSDSLPPHESQHARSPCPSPTPRSLPKHMPIKLVMPSSHLILCRPLLLLPPIPPSIRVFSNESTLRSNPSPWPTSNAEGAEVEWFYDDLLELTTPKDVLFIIGDCNVKVGSQEIPGVTGKFGLRVQNEAGRRLMEFCQENALVIANTLFQQHKRRLYTWT